jgi:archaellin
VTCTVMLVSRLLATGKVTGSQASEQVTSGIQYDGEYPADMDPAFSEAQLLRDGISA